MDDTMKKNISRNLAVITALLISTAFLIYFFHPADTTEQQVISARYSQPRGTDIRWHILIPDPPPAVVMMIQRIPPGTAVLNSSPALHSFDRETGTVKWLLTDVKPGKISMKMELDTPIRKKGEIGGEFIFEDKSKDSIVWLF
ncbi:MAG: hypothetical protein D3924_18670 [Candidatus Electrothrix sp. AR4]|nr:hypothetical protein [Candidatus Electrothrix sp. AR4]